MILNAGAETNESSASPEISAKNPSKSSLRITKDVDVSKNRSSSPGNKKRGRSKTVGCVDVKTKRPSSGESWMLYEGKSETSLRKNRTEAEQEEGDGTGQGKKSSTPSSDKRKVQNSETRKMSDGHKRMLVYEKPSETYSKLVREGSSHRSGKSKAESAKPDNRKPSEIPKLKQLAKLKCKIQAKATASGAVEVPLSLPSIPRSTILETPTRGRSIARLKELEQNRQDPKTQAKLKKEIKMEDKIKQAMKENFNTLIPLYQTELKKITDTWVNTVYCSLMLRTNLVKLLYQAMPGISRSQFHMEDETILHSLARAKSYTRSEAENLIQFIRLLIGNRNKAKDDYIGMLTNIEIAESYNNNWRALTKQITDIGEETKQLQLDIPELLKKKENLELATSDKIEKMEASISHREDEIKKLENQLIMLKKRESSYKGNISLKIEDYRDIKDEVLSLKSIEKEFEELKVKYTCQNDVYEKKIKDLEILLEERKKTLEKEKEVKKQLRTVLTQLHSHQKHLYRTIGKEQVDFVMGRSNVDRNKRRDQLWVSAIKLVLKGFLVQMKKLERDRNKMLLELNSNNLENYNNLAMAILQKDNFIKSIREQMQSFTTASKYPTTQTSETSVPECLKTEHHY